MRNSEVLAKFKTEFISGNYSKIHAQYRKERAQLYQKHKIVNWPLVPLIFIAIVSVMTAVISLLHDVTSLLFVAVAILILMLILIKINNLVFEKRQNKAHSKKSKYWKELQQLNEKYLQKYDSAIGYFQDLELGESGCSEYDDEREVYICSVTGRPISFDQHQRCLQTNSFIHCKYAKIFYDNLNEE